MVGEIYDCRRVSIGLELEGELIVIAPGVGCFDVKIAWVAFFAVGSAIGEFHTVAVGAAFPDAVHEACRTAVEGVGAVVDGQCVVFPVKRETAEGYAVGEPAGYLAGAGAVGEI